MYLFHHREWDPLVKWGHGETCLTGYKDSSPGSRLPSGKFAWFQPSGL